MQPRRIACASASALLALVLTPGCETSDDDGGSAAERCAAYVDRDGCATDPRQGCAWVEARPLLDASTCDLGTARGRCIVGDFYGDGCVDIDAGPHYLELDDGDIELASVHDFCGSTPVSEDWRRCIDPAKTDQAAPEACACIETP